MSHKRLVLGDVDFTGTPGSPFSIYALGTDSGTDWGNPEPVERELRSFLQDGAVVVTEGYGNRELFVAVETRRADSQSAADAEAALFLELGKRNTLTCYSDDGVAEPTVFDVITSSLQQLPNDLREHMQGDYNYLVRLVCEPWARAAEETVTEALISGSTTVVIDECDSLTGWTGTGTLTTGAEPDGNTYVASGNVQSPAMTKSLVVGLSSTPHIRVEWNYEPLIGGDKLNLAGEVNGVPMPKVAEEPSPTPGYLRTYFDSGGVTANQLRFSIFGPGTSGSLRIAQLVRTDALAQLGSTRQLARTVAVGGSARTQGSLEITHASSALGTVIAYTRPDNGIGYIPALRSKFLTSSGTTTTDSSLVSGARNDPTTALVYDIPAASSPDGTQAIWAFVRSTTADPQTFQWSARLRINGNDVGWVQTDTVTVNYVGSSTWLLVPLGHFRAPLTDMPNPGVDAFVRVTIQQTTSTGGAVCALDEAYLFEVENGDLTIVDCGTAAPSSGGSSRRLWLNSPTVDVPRPAILVGRDTDGNDARYPGPSAVQAFGVHEFRPGSMMAFTVTSNALNAAASLRHYRRGLTFGPQA